MKKPGKAAPLNFQSTSSGKLCLVKLADPGRTLRLKDGQLVALGVEPFVVIAKGYDGYMVSFSLGGGETPRVCGRPYIRPSMDVAQAAVTKWAAKHFRTPICESCGAVCEGQRGDGYICECVFNCTLKH